MGTRAYISMRSDEGASLHLYSQPDGDPTGVGGDLSGFLGAITLVNGSPGGAKTGQTANGSDDLFLQVATFLKRDRVGYIYLSDDLPRDQLDVMFAYYIDVVANEIFISCPDMKVVNFTPEQFQVACERWTVNDIVTEFELEHISADHLKG